MTTTIAFGGVTVPSLEGRYELGELLGEGTVGEVYAAHDVVRGIEVAVKVMRPALARSRRQVARFTQEAAISSRMLSPHAVKVLGLAVASEGSPCIVYERLVGETLAERIRREGTLSLADTSDIVKQTGRALARAHAIGVVHRDVKPDNIFLVDEGGARPLVKLLDFGIAAVVDGSNGTYSHELAGTPEYMAPELLLGNAELDQRSDLYSLAVVAFECLTGICPFPGMNLHEVVALLGRGTRPSLRCLRSDVHAEVNDWMDRALHPDPFWRFSSVKELIDTMAVAVRAAPPAAPDLRVAA